VGHPHERTLLAVHLHLGADYEQLPYGTMTDDEMRSMPIASLQDEGMLFLWVTGRAMEVGRECLRHWGYTRVDEVIWLKTNQLQRVIRTGRTGHWLKYAAWYLCEAFLLIHFVVTRKSTCS